MASSSADLWAPLAEAAVRESPLWAEALLESRAPNPVFSPLGEPRHALGLETIYEGYLVHYGQPRLFAPADGDVALLLGDYLYAQGLVRITELGDVGAVADLAELISLCAQQQADGRAERDGAAWAATAALLGRGSIDKARAALRERGDATLLEAAARAAAGDAAVERALIAHRQRVG